MHFDERAIHITRCTAINATFIIGLKAHMRFPCKFNPFSKQLLFHYIQNLNAINITKTRRASFVYSQLPQHETWFIRLYHIKHSTMHHVKLWKQSQFQSQRSPVLFAPICVIICSALPFQLLMKSTYTFTVCLLKQSWFDKFKWHPQNKA